MTSTCQREPGHNADIDAENVALRVHLTSTVYDLIPEFQTNRYLIYDIFGITNRASDLSPKATFVLDSLSDGFLLIVCPRREIGVSIHKYVSVLDIYDLWNIRSISRVW